jgi:hypothetical protein
MDPASGRFDPVQLRRALVRRGLSAEEFAQEVACGRSSVFKALTGHGLRDRTAIAILRGLADLPPRLELDD